MPNKNYVQRTIYISKRVDDDLELAATRLQISVASVIRIILGDKDAIDIDLDSDMIKVMMKEE